MKKKLIILTISLSLFVAHANEKADKVNQNLITKNNIINNKKSLAEVSDFTDFQNKILKKYSSLGITSFEVSKYSKGTELLFLTNKRNFSRKKFIEISKFSLKELRNTYEIDKTIKIPTALSYQKDSKSNAIFLYEYKE